MKIEWDWLIETKQGDLFVAWLRVSAYVVGILAGIAVLTDLVVWP